MLYDRYVTKGENYLKLEVLCGMMEMVPMHEATTTVSTPSSYHPSEWLFYFPYLGGVEARAG